MIELAPKRPDWLKVRAPGGKNYNELQMLMRDLALHTVCEEARCPNIGECWGHRTATFMILGDTCTRACGFCAVKTGRPGALDWGEPERVARAVQTMGLKHVVVTSVNRDDQPDGGSLIFAATIRKIRAYVPGCTVEVLTPDFEGVRSSLENVLRARPDVFNHNVETVERLTKAVRRRAKYRRSLEVLRMAKEIAPGLCTKSGIMVGLGEMRAEITQTMQDLRACDVDILTIGQYLRPTPQHLDVVRYYHPDEFAELKAEGLALGFKHVESGPLVRSSYHAHEHAAIAGSQ
jgi:lipoyl synthase